MRRLREEEEKGGKRGLGLERVEERGEGRREGVRINNREERKKKEEERRLKRIEGKGEKEGKEDRREKKVEGKEGKKKKGIR